MASAKKGDTVKVHYTGTLEDGTVFDSSVGRDPLTFTLGSGQVIPGFEEAVIGLEVGQGREVKLPPEQAYGARRDDLIVPLPRQQMPPGEMPTAGQVLELHMQDGGVLRARVMQVTPEAVVIDANHELAGKTLIFEIELVEFS